ncbi:uncharacterized protein [Lolium perenne]|uniref:uncharacterized protein n=1 Tax=Lolium perenne TaxID=4522 RepID=UPI003A99B1CB
MPTLRRVRPRTAGEEADRLSALPEELIRLILSKLGTRAALSTAVLARRWARIPRELPAFDFRVRDVLAPEYERTVALRARNLPRDEDVGRMLDGLVASCERATMKAFVDGIAGFLEADGGRAHRSAKTLRLEFFETRDVGVVDRLIATAVAAWGVEEVEVVVRPAYTCDEDVPPAYSLRLKEDGHRSRVRSLTLGNCMVPPQLQRYDALTTLVLRDMAASTPVDVYERVFSQCTRLQVLHLTFCCCLEDWLVVDAPCSEIRELVVEACSFLVIELRNLPMLARLACLTNTVEIVFGSVPCLTHTNLTFFVEQEFVDSPPPHTELEQFLGTSPSTMENLVIRFTGPRRWVQAECIDNQLFALKRLLVADLPSNWDATLPRLLLMAAPSLEVLHIHVAHSDIEPQAFGVIWTKTSQEQQYPTSNLKELVMVGFTQQLHLHHMEFLKYVVSECTALQRLVLLKDGHVRYNGLWDWDMQHECRCWSDKDKRAVRRMIKSGSSPLVQLVLG